MIMDRRRIIALIRRYLPEYEPAGDRHRVSTSRC